MGNDLEAQLKRRLDDLEKPGQTRFVPGPDLAEASNIRSALLVKRAVARFSCATTWLTITVIALMIVQIVIAIKKC